MTTTTGDDPGSETTGAVAVRLVGDKGQSAPCVLKSANSKHKPFQAGATDKFKVTGRI